MNNSIWLPNGSSSQANEEMFYDNSSRGDQKRGHQCFTDTSEQEPFFNKKQAIESITGTPGPALVDGSLWRGGSSSQPEGHRGDRPYGQKPVESSTISDKNMCPIVSASVNMEKKGFENQFANDSSTCLSMSHAGEDPLFSNTGARKVKVNEVTISENSVPELVRNTFYPIDKNKVMSSTFQRAGNNICRGPTFNTANGNTISLDPTFSSMDKKFISVGQASSKTDGNFMFVNQYYNGMDNNALSIGQAFKRGSYNINTVADHYRKENGNFISMGPAYSKGHDNFFAVDPFYNKVNEPFMPANAAYNKGDTSVGICGQHDADVVVPYNKENPSISSMVENSKGEQATISFGAFQGNTEERDISGRLISSYDVLFNQSSAGALGPNDSAAQQSANVVSAATSKADGVKKNKEPKTKKGSSNNFPSNVKSLLSTGIFDGVPVKYVSWSREKNLRGVVKGTGYLCSCQECKLSKVVNAYEFERHAGCKTKHPNNHIYFENGKTIYAVVQELKNTPQEMLFEVIQNVTGSSVNQKNFSTWKASYQAATRELQRIYGKDGLVVPS